MAIVNTVFITGATGNIGGKIVSQFLEEDHSTRLVLLVRGDSNVAAQKRVEDVLRILSPEIDLIQVRRQIEVICGDITLNEMGLPESVWRHLSSEVTHIVHAAATTQFQLPLECARLVNYTGTMNVMALARKVQETGNLKRVAYISTSFICGRKGGNIYEDDFDSSPRFSNTYEQTKWEAERLVRNLMASLPITIFRPSIVVGDSQTGRTITFNTLYTPLKYIQQGILTALPCSPHTPLDIVPLDFVSNSILHIFMKCNHCIGRTYHIASGRAKEVTVGEIVDLALHYFNLSATRIKFSIVDPASLEKALQLIKVYEPYLCTVRHFENTNTTQALKGTNIPVPSLSNYFNNIMEYCFATDRGRQMRYAA